MTLGSRIGVRDEGREFHWMRFAGGHTSSHVNRLLDLELELSPLVSQGHGGDGGAPALLASPPCKRIVVASRHACSEFEIGVFVVVVTVFLDL
ncbi:hypothetical protein LSTR_LSTR008415 [Laodelphax striatellus]|uniref:Uncharacterized protein n=1 Tax=Laodelphax striatellus TaxID=195883 RepID=A0A482XV29_LAOST|nr:hypothetical protein LSTR_LSTR008415 [Laodelphax striatellus]